MDYENDRFDIFKVYIEIMDRYSILLSLLQLKFILQLYQSNKQIKIKIIISFFIYYKIKVIILVKDYNYIRL